MLLRRTGKALMVTLMEAIEPQQLPTFMNDAEGSWQINSVPGNDIEWVMLAKFVILPTLPFKKGINGTPLVSK